MFIGTDMDKTMYLNATLHTIMSTEYYCSVVGFSELSFMSLLDITGSDGIMVSELGSGNSVPLSSVFF